VKFDPDAAERRLRRNSWLLVGVISGLGLFWGASVAAAIAVSGALSALNVESLVKLVHVATARSPDSAYWVTILGVGLRYLLLGFGLFVIVSVWRVNVVAICVGLSVPVAAVFVEWGLDSVREFRSG
jgi:hypothetical protein